MPKIQMSVADAVDFLAAVGCDRDPVEYRVCEYLVREMNDIDLVVSNPDGYPASQLKIKYWKAGEYKIVKGSLYSMVVDRLRDYFRSIK